MEPFELTNETITWIDHQSFENIRNNDALEPGYYAVVSAGIPQYAFSVDGIGCIWYNTEADMWNGIPAE